jgi:hypothetical protein
LFKTSKNSTKLKEIEDDAKWEGFKSPENGEVGLSDRLCIKPGPPPKKLSRKPEPSTQKKKLLVQKKDFSPSKDEAKRNSFELLENAVNDEVDGRMPNNLYNEGNH